MAEQGSSLCKIAGWIIVSAMLCAGAQMIGQMRGQRQAVRNTVQTFTPESARRFNKMDPDNPYFAENPAGSKTRTGRQ